MNKIIITFIFLLFTKSAFAAHPEHNHDGLPAEKTIAEASGSQCSDLINVKVNGLVCDFCARALEKVIGKREDVVGITVDLDNGLVQVAMEPGKTIDDATITQLINDSGYNVNTIDKGC